MSPPFAARCCHLANHLTNFTGDRQTNKRTNVRTSPSHNLPRIFERGFKIPRSQGNRFLCVQRCHPAEDRNARNIKPR